MDLTISTFVLFLLCCSWEFCLLQRRNMHQTYWLWYLLYIFGWGSCLCSHIKKKGLAKYFYLVFCYKFNHTMLFETNIFYTLVQCTHKCILLYCILWNWNGYQSLIPLLLVIQFYLLLLWQYLILLHLKIGVYMTKCWFRKTKIACELMHSPVVKELGTLLIGGHAYSEWGTQF